MPRNTQAGLLTPVANLTRSALLFGGRLGGGSRFARGAVVTAIASITASTAGLLAGSGCVFVPPPPLPEELEAEAAKRSSVQTAPDAQGPMEETEGTAEEAEFAEGDPPPLDMSPEEMRAYATAQGDPEGGEFTPAEAFAGLEGEGALWATLELEEGTIACRLYEAEAPLTVANFVGLARGVRPFRDPASGQWRTGPYYDGTIIHRAVPGFIIQGGDPTGTGLGNAGYVIPDELTSSFEHDRPGVLSMANRGPGSGSSQFFITLGPAPHLDRQHTIFGQCTKEGVAVAEQIAARADAENRPEPPAEIERVTIERRAGEPSPRPRTPPAAPAAPAEPAESGEEPDEEENEAPVREMPQTIPKF